MNENETLNRRVLLVHVFSRSYGHIITRTYESSEEMIKKFFSNEATVIKHDGLSDDDSPVEHYFEVSGAGDIGLLTVAVFKEAPARMVTPIKVQGLVKPT